MRMDLFKSKKIKEWLSNGIYDFNFELSCVRNDFGLKEDAPEEIIKDILLENDFVEYAEMLFPETKT